MGEMLDYSYSEEYFALIDEMIDLLDACERGLREKKYGYKARSTNYMQAFHNLARAFLPPENPMRASIGEAREYAHFWLGQGLR